MTTTEIPAPQFDPSLDYHALNAMLNLYDENGKIQFAADKEAAKRYFLEHVNQNTVFFHSLEEKIDYLIENNYYEKDVFDQYDWEFVKDLYKQAYAHKFRFPTFMAAYKYFTTYTLRTNDGKRYLERYEDRVVVVALFLAQGDEQLAQRLVDDMILGRFQPATPTFLNAGKAQRGELVSCMLLRTEDNMESISRNITNSLQLSKRGAGVALLLTNLRERGAPIKNIEGQSSGVVPVMKLLEDSFKYSNQLGQRPGAGAVYLHAHHPDIMRFLDTKRENADEATRIKTLSLGVVVPDITFELAKRNADMYLFSPYDVERVYGVAFSDINVTEKYHEMVDDPRIRKSKINARELFQTIAELQFESGYPYLMFEDTVNRNHALPGKITHSNLCVTGDTEILTDDGYRRVRDLFESQEDFDVVVDTRARDMNLTASGVSTEKSTRMCRTSDEAEVFKISTAEGFELTATEWHKMYVDRDGEIVKIPLNEVEVGDRVLVQSAAGKFGMTHNPDLAYLAGVIAADGTIVETTTSAGHATASARVYLYGDKMEFADAVEQSAAKALVGFDDLVERQSTLEPKVVYSPLSDRGYLQSAPLSKLLAEHGMTAATKTAVPEFVLRGDRATQRAYISGLYQMDATITGNERIGSLSIELGSTDVTHLRQVQRMLLNFGVYTRVYPGRKTAGTAMLPDGRGGLKEYNQKPTFTLRATDRTAREGLYELVDWLRKHEEYWDARCAGIKTDQYYHTHRFRATVLSIASAGVEPVYDVTVENGHSVIFNGIATGQCSEIAQASTPSTFTEDGYYDEVGKDISCNLASLNIAKAMDSGDLGMVVDTAMRALTTVTDTSNITAVPPIAAGNAATHAVGLGAMNLHGYLGREHIHYGSPVALEFVSAYFAAVNFFSLRTSMELAKERGETFDAFPESTYADGTYFDKYVEKDWRPTTQKVADLFSFDLPSPEDWKQLRDDVAEHGLYLGYRLAIAPTGSISYVNHSTSSIHPVVAPIEVRKESKVGRVMVPQYGLTNNNREYFTDAYELGPQAVIDTYAAAQEHVDQSLSCTLFFKDTATTRDVNKAQIAAWRAGLKTVYYIRIRQQALEGTEAEMCVSCAI